MEPPTGRTTTLKGESLATNIWKLSELLTNDETQTVWYQAGVGSDSSSTAARAKRTHALLSMAGFAQGAKVAAGGSMVIKLIESGFGVGTSETVINGYRTIVHLYRPGDQIYFVGFSRGAFAARCIAGVISRCGLLQANYEQFAADVVQIYRTRRDDVWRKVKGRRRHAKEFWRGRPDGLGK
jgi:uncharacterized protein (DUF2235 family)